ncbi:uncharacterized protein K489DRAFT_408885 [Dissoconium aciculare CBS 342.82]|uniref:F-box domain-containing protein n=1 Tax=Dissoconium aciculare CBS 342.82 TaxID=1314786 RepID=A0A6J3M9J2_9PEZI|nr:uncharacterized protein K489DRAFT_408885 [Dissoconium aciculare CBS 342.82]KAF1824518.1 hypothetical protein K489DRAFT_408885 [Dissoconium aciculare CBS 342.82]
MFSKLRRLSSTLSIKSNSSSQSELDSGYASHRTSITGPPCSDLDSFSFSRTTSWECQPPASLLGLPYDIRQRIFRHLATSTNLTLCPPRVANARQKSSSPRKSTSVEPVPLLLVNRQLRTEYAPVLLANAAIEIRVLSYDFSNLAAALSNHSEADRTALSRNVNIWIQVIVSHVPTSDDQARLKEWTIERSILAARVAQSSATHWELQRQASIIPEADDETSDTEDSESQDIVPNMITKAARCSSWSPPSSWHSLPSSLSPWENTNVLPQFHYRVRFASQIRGPRPSNRYPSGSDGRLRMELDLLASHVKMINRVKMEVEREHAAEMDSKPSRHGKGDPRYGSRSQQSHSRTHGMQHRRKWEATDEVYEIRWLASYVISQAERLEQRLEEDAIF